MPMFRSARNFSLEERSTIMTADYTCSETHVHSPWFAHGVSAFPLIITYLLPDLVYCLVPRPKVIIYFLFL